MFHNVLLDYIKLKKVSNALMHIGCLESQCNGCVKFELNDIVIVYKKTILIEDFLSAYNILSNLVHYLYVDIIVINYLTIGH